MELGVIGVLWFDFAGRHPDFTKVPNTTYLPQVYTIPHRLSRQKVRKGTIGASPVGFERTTGEAPIVHSSVIMRRAAVLSTRRTPHNDGGYCGRQVLQPVSRLKSLSSPHPSCFFVPVPILPNSKNKPKKTLALFPRLLYNSASNCK